MGCPSEGRAANLPIPGTFMLGYTGLNFQKPANQREVAVMQAASVCSGFQAQADSTHFHFAPQPNRSFNADANTGHAFGILMARVGTLRTSCSGAG